MRDKGEDSGTRHRRWYIVGGALAIVVVVVGVVVWWFVFRDDAPAAVDLETAVAQLDEDLTDAEGDDSAATDAEGDDSAATDGEGDDSAATDADQGETDQADGDPDATRIAVDISGEWTVDTTIGSFDYETASGSFAGFRVDEELTLGEATAVGRTGDVTGTIVIEGSTLVATEIEIDMTTITTNRSQRDSRVHGALETEVFPTATFSLTSPVELPEGATRGDPFSVEAIGDLTVHGVTNPATFTIDAQLVDEVAVVVGSTEIVFDDYDVTAPSAPIVLSVEDHGIVEFQLLFTR